MEIPEKVRRNAALLGDSGVAWLARLPHLIAELERRWLIEIGAPMRRGSEAFVAEARTGDGLDVVVKIVLPGIDPAHHELHILRAAAGIGYARLIQSDEDNHAMLLERLGPQLFEFGHPEAMRMEIISATLRDAWRLPAEGFALPTGADKAVEFASNIALYWRLLGRPCSERAIDLALSYSERRRRVFDPARSVPAHGDAHEWNTLKASGTATGFKFVDPDGVFAEPAFDLAIPMREWGEVLPAGDLVQLGGRRCSLLSRFTGVEPQPIWEWALIQCVMNGLLLHRIGVARPASVSLAMADAWAVSGDFADR